MENETNPNLTIADTVAADYILTQARTVGTLFGTRKVFLGSLGIDWGNPTHLRVLLALVRSGLIECARADLVAAMDPALVACSRVEDPRGAVYHFVVVGA